MGKDRLKLILEAPTKTQAEHYAQGFRRAMRQSGQAVKGKVLVVRTTSGFAAVFKGDGWNPRSEGVSAQQYEEQQKIRRRYLPKPARLTR